MSDVPTSASKKIPVMEIFGPTVQGEGAVIGLQTYFIRFGGCDYKCKMCDSIHAVDPQLVNRLAQWIPADKIFELFRNFRDSKGVHTPRWVTLSGGNPCIHDLTDFVLDCNEANIDIAVETQGTIWQEWLLGTSHVTVSPKGPGMGERYEQDKLDEFMNRMHGNPMCMKIVIFDQRDIEFAKMLYERYVLVKAQLRPSQFFLSQGNRLLPGTETDIARSHHRANLIKDYEFMLRDIQKEEYLCNVKYLPQWHVIVWGNKQGV